MRVAFEYPTLDLLFRFNRRQIGERQEIVAFVMGAFCRELLPALVVDHTRNQVREGAGIRIAGCLRTNGVTLDHPAAAQTQHAVQSSAERGHFSRG